MLNKRMNTLTNRQMNKKRKEGRRPKEREKETNENKGGSVLRNIERSRERDRGGWGGGETQLKVCFLHRSKFRKLLLIPGEGKMEQFEFILVVNYG